MAEAGAPIIEPVPRTPGSSYVTFVWHGDSDTHNVAVIDGVALGVGGADPAQSLMTRLPNTDIWYRTYLIRNDARFHYWLSPNDSLQSLRILDRESNAQPDPLNPKRMAIGPSYVELENAPVSEPTLVRDDVTEGVVETYELHSQILDNDRSVSVYTPPGFEEDQGLQELPLLVVFDRPSYLSLVPVPTILDNLIADGRIAPTVAVLVGSPNRDVELGASSGFTRFLVEELVPWAR